MNKKLRIIMTVVSPIFWFALLVSVSLYLFYWRVSNEPGGGSAAGFLLAHRILMSLGLAATIVINIIFIKYREKKVWIVWVANLAATLIYSPVFGLTLFMMV